MAVLKIDEAGFDRCSTCRRTQYGGWIGSGKSREFLCTRCIGRWLRKLAKLTRGEKT